MQSEVFMMTDKIYTIDEICEKVQPIAEKYKLIRVSLFGSYARGEATAESDIDLYIQASKDSYKLDSLGSRSNV